MRLSEADLELWRILDQRRTPGVIIASKGALRVGDYWVHNLEQPADAEFLAQSVHVVAAALAELQWARQENAQLRQQLAAKDKRSPAASSAPPSIAQLEQRIAEQSAIIAEQQAALKAQNALLARFIHHGTLFTALDGSLWQVVWRETQFSNDAPQSAF